MGDGILDGYPIIQDQTSPNLAHIPTTNEITYSEDLTQLINATNGSGSQTTVTINYALSPDGNQNAGRLQGTTTSSGYALRGFSLNTSSAETYTQSVYLKSNTGSNQNIAFYGRNTLGLSVIVTNEWQRFELTGSSSTNYYAYFGLRPAFGSDSTCDILVYGFQLEQQSQATAYIKSDGIAAVRKSSTTNLISYSEDFSSYDQIQNITLIPNSTTSPIGTNNATKVLSTANNSKVRDNISVVNGTTYTFSIYCKNIDATMIKLLAFDGVTEYQSALTSQVSTTQWTRISITFTSGNTGLGQIQFARDMPNGESAFFWGAQFEEQTQAETYAKTTGLPVTIDLFTENNYGTMTNMSASDIIEDTPNN
jgi:hypothetical protein